MVLADFKRLCTFFQSSPSLNSVLNCFETSIQESYNEVLDALNSLDIDKCEGEYLDNLGMLVGIDRHFVSISENFLKSDDDTYFLDKSRYFVSGFEGETGDRIVTDREFRTVIRAKIIKNSLKTYSTNALEQIIKNIFPFEAIDNFYIEIDSTSGLPNAIKMYISDTISRWVEIFLTNFWIVNGKKVFFFPLPEHIQNVTLIKI